MYLILIFISGFVGLVYEVLWMKQLGLLFGNTSYAAGATLAAFFGGLAIGSWLWGRRAGRMKRPLRAYAWLQIGIAATAVLYFVILHVYSIAYPFLYQRIGSEWWLLAVKFALTAVLVFPPTLFMGGTIPVIGQYLIRKRSNFGHAAALLYGVNTLGAALGAFVAGFYLPLWFGFSMTIIAAMVLNGLTAIGALLLSRRDERRARNSATAPEPKAQDRKRAKGKGKPAPPPESGKRWAVFLACFLSGFGFLALEVLWTRIFAQVLENSVYTFAAILVIALCCLSAGAFVSSQLSRFQISPLHCLALLLLVSGLAVAATPFIFMQLTDSLQILAMRGSWPSYILMIFRKGFLAFGPSAFLLGTVFPFLMKTEEKYMSSAGKSLGQLAAVNTAGAIVGALACGFIFLETLGMWGTMRLIAVTYVVAAMIMPVAWDARGIALRTAGAIVLLLAFTGLDPTKLPINSTDPMRRYDEKILETWEGSNGTVAVVRNPYGVTIKMNSHYGLGSTGALRQQELQADVPLMAYPDTESIFFLGMGTGITAGRALAPQFEQVKRVVVCELVPEVITAAKKYMTDVDGRDFTNGLFDDPRASVLAKDGRHYLMATKEKFDMINGDLFVPFKAGVGSLYTKDHFQNVKDRLTPGGVYFQWIPLYQVTETEFSILTKTMLEVFDQVSLWRTNFQPGQDVLALAGHNDGAPLPPSDIDSRADKRMAVAGRDSRDLGSLQLPFNSKTVTFFYCGNVSEAKELFDEYPVNTDDRPVIEYMAPRNYRRETGEDIPWFIGPRMAEMVEAVLERCPPQNEDQLLINRTPANRRLPLAGAAYYRARLWRMMGDERMCARAWQRFVDLWTWEPDADPREE